MGQETCEYRRDIHGCSIRMYTSSVTNRIRRTAWLQLSCPCRWGELINGDPSSLLPIHNCRTFRVSCCVDTRALPCLKLAEWWRWWFTVCLLGYIAYKAVTTNQTKFNTSWTQREGLPSLPCCVDARALPCLKLAEWWWWWFTACLLGYNIAYKAVLVQNKPNWTYGHKRRVFLPVTDMVIAPRQYRKVLYPPCLLTWV